MKKLILFFVLALGFSSLVEAQNDDLYFVPDKSAKKAEIAQEKENPTYYRGSHRSVDEYNRAGRFRSYYQKIGSDSLGNDIITFRPGNGVYADRTYIDTAYVYPGSAQFDDEDFAYSRRMSRWDGFYDPWLYSYGPWRYGMYNPWYYGYGGWYDPWYSSWYGGWYDPWYYGYAGWYGPYYRGWYGRYYNGWYDPWYYGGYAGTYVRYSGGNPRGLTGDRTWTYGNRGNNSSYGNYGRNSYSRRNGSNSTYTTSSSRNRSFGRRTTTVPSTRSYGNNSSFGNSTRSSSSFGSGSFGRSGGSSSGSFGGGRSNGGGSFGGGGHFGGGRR